MPVRLPQRSIAPSFSGVSKTACPDRFQIFACQPEIMFSGVERMARPDSEQVGRPANRLGARSGPAVGVKPRGRARCLTRTRAIHACEVSSGNTADAKGDHLASSRRPLIRMPLSRHAQGTSPGAAWQLKPERSGGTPDQLPRDCPGVPPASIHCRLLGSFGNLIIVTHPSESPSLTLNSPPFSSARR